MKNKKNTHNVFWTGGRDSTFRVLQLLFTTEEEVQPHYVIRHEESTGNEIDAMNNIRRALSRNHPDIRPKLLPTVYINEGLIPSFKEIDDAIDELRKTIRVHEQYQILASYCKASDISEVDISYERDTGEDQEKNAIAGYFGKEFPFESLKNPLEEMTKMDCYLEAKDQGWDDLLNMTSFCRRPKRKGRPCGTCGPCCDTVAEGMGFRLSFTSRMKARILMPFRKFYRKNYLKHDNSWFFRMIRRRLEHKL
jgi:hypothetical protein